MQIQAKQTAERLWVPILAQLQRKVPSTEFEAWLLSLEPEVAEAGRELRLVVPTMAFQMRIETRYLESIRQLTDRKVVVCVRRGMVSSTGTGASWREQFTKKPCRPRVAPIVSTVEKSAVAEGRAAEAPDQEVPGSAVGGKPLLVSVTAPPEGLSCQLIFEEVAGFYGITPEKLISKDRRPVFRWPRNVAAYLCRELLPISLPELGREFGERDHTTVMRAAKEVFRQLEGERGDLLRVQLTQIKVLIKARVTEIQD